MLINYSHSLFLNSLSFLKIKGLLWNFLFNSTVKLFFLHHHKLRPKLSIRAIVKELHYSKDIVQTWINRYQETGDVQDEERRGRKRKTSEKEDLNIISITKKT